MHAAVENRGRAQYTHLVRDVCPQVGDRVGHAMPEGTVIERHGRSVANGVERVGGSSLDSIYLCLMIYQLSSQRCKPIWASPKLPDELTRRASRAFLFVRVAVEVDPLAVWEDEVTGKARVGGRGARVAPTRRALGGGGSGSPQRSVIRAIFNFEDITSAGRSHNQGVRRAL